MRGHIQAWGKKPNTFKIWLNLPPVKGKQKQETFVVHGSKKEAEAKMAERITEIERGDYSRAGRLTVSKAADRWLLKVLDSPKVGAKTYNRYEGIVRDYIKPYLGHVQLRKLTSDHIDDAVAQWRKAVPIGRKKGTLKERTVHHIFVTLKTMLRQAVRSNMISRNPCDSDSVEAPSKGRPTSNGSNKMSAPR